MTFSSAPRIDNAASIVGGILGGLAVAGSVLAFFAIRDPRDGRGADESITELRIEVAELRAQTAELRTQLAHREPPPPPFPPPLPPAPPTIEISIPQAPAPDFNAAIQCPGEHRCTLDRAYLEELLANPTHLAKQARVIPAVQDGVTRGFKLYGIRPGSLPKLLGYKNGDLVLSINGVPLSGMDAAMTSYTHLRRADTFTVEIERKGERILKSCDLR